MFPVNSGFHERDLVQIHGCFCWELTGLRLVIFRGVRMVVILGGLRIAHVGISNKIKLKIRAFRHNFPWRCCLRIWDRLRHRIQWRTDTKYCEPPTSF
ncbi:hypothetical protein ACN38_g6861 [Penicillium nordicum]|uniref:Uncharacterized protein n=1 Tax=Penicillium nordicum TaxID=229535 RepID=A0A0M9WF02_9EURO|nr:hypothetical protein ACN38_g6861 [Penicillium nordicum]